MHRCHKQQSLLKNGLYILIEYGQPLHFFDKNKLGNKIVVRMANDNEKLVTLDEQERTLESRDIVICDNKINAMQFLTSDVMDKFVIMRHKD